MPKYWEGFGFMTYHGHVKNGAVILDDPVSLPEGMEVMIATQDFQISSAFVGDFSGVCSLIPNI